MKTSVRIVLMLLVMLILFGCSAQEPRSGHNGGQELSNQSSSETTQETTAESAQSGNEPLTFSDQQEQTQSQGSFMNLSMNGEVLKMKLEYLVQRDGSYHMQYSARDVQNNMLAIVSLDIPVRGMPGDQFTEDDEYQGTMAQVSYMDRNKNRYSTHGDSQSDYSTYEEFINPSSPKYREGRKFVIAIDDVSTDGNLISGRLIAEFIGRDNDSSDNTVIKIDESSFVFDVRDGSN
jgi:hypothetical protein